MGRALAADVGVSLRSTDDLVGVMGWEDSIAEVQSWMSAPGPWVVEGVTAVRALRAWLSANDDGIPCERIFWSESAKVDQTPGQARMGKGLCTVWSQIESTLLERGVSVQRF